MKATVYFIFASVWFIGNAYALSVEEVKKKVSKYGSASLSFKECKIIGSEYSNYDENGKLHEEGFHCAYVSDENKLLQPDEIKEKYKDFKGTLKEFCEKIITERNERPQKNYVYLYEQSFNEDTLECDTGGDIAQKRYDTMKPILRAQHFEIKEAKLLERTKAEEKRNKEAAKVNAKWESRKGNTKSLKAGNNYTCESNGGGIFASVAGTTTSLDMGSSSINFRGITYRYVDSYNQYKLYKNYRNGEKVKVLKENAINQQKLNYNVIYQDLVRYYCD